MQTLIARIRDMRAADLNWQRVNGQVGAGRFPTAAEFADADRRVADALTALPKPIRWIWS